MNRSYSFTSVDDKEKIVISGIAGRFPKCDNLKELQENLLNKMDLASSDHGRWSNAYNMPYRIGKINNLEKFDSEFFNTSAVEADVMDPVSRTLLEHTYEAIIDSGVNPKELRGTRTSIFTAISMCESRSNYIDEPQLAGLFLTGCNVSTMANRISYWLGVTGYSHNIDTACSSSMVAIVKAYETIRTGDCDAAIIAAGNVCLHPQVQYQFHDLGVLSSDGYCKPFDAKSRGYMRSDTAAVVFLQRAKDARRVYATFVHGKINCDGFKEEGITYPSAVMQRTLLEEFYEECGISPNELSYLEAHTTGTIAGDPVEVMSIDQALCAKRDSPMSIGSVKSNLGHSEAASGFCQIAKVLLAMETGIIAPTIHLKNPRGNLSAIIEGRIKVVTEPMEWKGGYVGINSYGFGGANAHILLKSNSKEKINNGTPDDDLPRLIVASGRTKEAVEFIFEDMRNRPIDTEFISLLHNIHNDDIEGHLYRGYMITGSKVKSHYTINKIEHSLYTRRPICFIFSGLGSQWFGMSRALMKFPAFEKAIKKCDSVLKSYGIQLTDILTSDNKSTFDNVINLLLGLIGLQIGTVDLLTSIGIVPDFIIGHSIGELVCGYADGCLTAEETILLAYFVGLALDESKTINGSMAEINIDPETIGNVRPSDIDVACYNGSSNFIVSGPADSVTTFLAKLRAIDVSVKEIFSGGVPFHSRYIELARAEAHLDRILPERKFRSSRWLTTSEYSSKLSPLCSKYYTSHLSFSVSFANAMRSIPRNAVTIEISALNIFQHILKNDLCSTITNMALYKYIEEDDDDSEIFLESIGKLYNARLQPQIANLYPMVEFPVSCGTPMISPLIKWDHSNDYFVKQFCQKKLIDRREIAMTVSLSEVKFMYLKGHVVNEKNLFPAMGYLFYIWEMVAALENQEYTSMPIVFEDISFIRATVLSEQSEIELIFSIQEGSNKFEITEGDSVVVTGKVRIPSDIESEKILPNLNKFVDDKEEMNTRDIYKELRLRGYQYTDLFQGLKSTSITGSNGHIAWTSNWVTFMDNMLQMMILGRKTRSLSVPTGIQKLTIDPKYHIQQIENYLIEERQFSVRHYKNVGAVISGGIEISGLMTTSISRRQKAVSTVLEEYKFISHRDSRITSLQDAIRMSVHIALECYNIINVKIIEFLCDSDKVTPEDLNSLLVNEILNDLPQIRHHTRLVTSGGRFSNITLPTDVSATEMTKLSRDENCLMVLGFDILSKKSKKLYDQLLSLLMPQGFLLTLERTDTDRVSDYSYLETYNLEVVVEKRIDDKTLLLLRKTQNIWETQYQVVRVDNHDFSWVDELKSTMNAQSKAETSTRVMLVAEGDSECGLLGLVNCLRREPGGEVIRSVFIQDEKAPAFSLREPLYANQLRLDLPINVLRSGNAWGSYRHFPLPPLEPKYFEAAYVTQKVQGDLSTFIWKQSEMSRINHEDFINVVYTSLNFRDVMIASGKLNFESATSFQRNNDLIGMEYVGFHKNKQRIMGLCSHGGMTNILTADKYLSWIIPDKWTMEDAATIPCVYSTCYYALFMKGKMKKGNKILIHSGTGGIGQAAIHLALHEGCEVFTTVGTAEKRQFLRNTFPSILEENIGNSRDTTFEEMIMRRTAGRGVDIVLNSLAEEKLQTSIRCLANGGRFLEIGKFDIVSNNPLDLSFLSKGISFYSIMLDQLFCSDTKIRLKIDLQTAMQKGMENGAIKPLCRKIFEKNEIEAAFKYMAAGKHIGKIIIKIHKDDECLDAPLLAHPQYYCLEHKCYVILGGLGGFGLELADWLILRGAKNLVLTSRTGIRTGYQRSRVKLWRSNGVDVQIVRMDDTLRHEDCEYILKFAEGRAPVDAIFNLAVVLKDCAFQNQSAQMFEDSFKPKAWLTKKMDELSRTICPQLRHFIVFSSVSCGRGNAGQTNYGMANSVMERICEKRVKEGLHGLAIQWGAIGDVGLVADMQENNKELVIGGTLQQRISSCLDKLEEFLLQDRPVVSSMVVAEKAKTGGTMNIYERIAHIMGLKNINAVPPNVPLVEMGMDSMMAVEIKQTLEREFDISLTVQDIRNLNFTKLREMTVATESRNMHEMNKVDASNVDGMDRLIRKIQNSDFVPDVLVEFTKKEIDEGDIFLLPGIEGCSSVFTSLTSGIKFSATCLQHGVSHIPDESHSVVKSAAYLLPYVLKKMKDRKEFLLVGYSFGSLIAIELTRLLEANGFSGQLILIDGAPDQLKYLINQYMPYTSPEELQNIVLLGLLNVYAVINKETIALELNGCNKLDEKLKVFRAYFPKDLNALTTENQKLIYLSIYNHVMAVKGYDISSLPRLKTPIILLKPTFPIVSLKEEDYGLHKVTENEVRIYYVEGNHITMMDNDQVISIINKC